MRIWGIAKPLEELSQDEILTQIRARQAWINSLRSYLWSADHGAYGLDRNAIESYLYEISLLESFVR